MAHKIKENEYDKLDEKILRSPRPAIKIPDVTFSELIYHYSEENGDKRLLVSPTEIESLLCNHPAVDDAAVIRILDSFMVEVPRAYVVLKQSFKLEPAELLQFVSVEDLLLFDMSQ
ncbi:uncharacterized protein LOC143249005 isoform X2 [Tachypleus tridentatus]